MHAYIHASGFAASSRLLSEESPPTSARPPPVLTRPDYVIDISVTLNTNILQIPFQSHLAGAKRYY